ncbi:hypothetical protein [Streptomyces sp. V4I2]|uniref:hypothetical protein n=1 Tax=Streptomyces sp. V4I2 TaxID=3042280 RepID=UPI0027860FE1|nr:hypothetical protein [Streptomyces sp. V4I2]MDQ1044384.1 hypothetical protein [Streptomyces sp. V4I2]
MELSAGRIATQLRDLDGVTLGAGKRALGTRGAKDELWQARLPAPYGLRAKVRQVAALDTEASGRYLQMDNDDHGDVGEPEAVRMVMKDLVSGLCYSAVFPLGIATWERTQW